VVEAWAQERWHLQSLAGRSPFPYVPEVTRRVARDAYVSYGTSRYSVPWEYAGREVQVRLVDGQVQVWHGGQCVAQHAVSEGRHGVRTVPAHHAGMPYGPSGRSRRSAPLRLTLCAPEVQVRSLGVYDGVAEGG
jgi:hypothetical protein